jgi:hypothetical protein
MLLVKLEQKAVETRQIEFRIDRKKRKDKNKLPPGQIRKMATLLDMEIMYP